MTTPNVRETVAFHAERVRDAIRSARSGIPYGQRQRDVYVTGLAKAALGDKRCKCVEQVTALVVDVAQRGTLADAESIADTLRTIARCEYERTHPAPVLSLTEAWEAEERAEGEKNAAERAAMLTPTEANHLRFAATKRAYEIADGALADALRREVHRRLHANLTRES